MIRRNRHTRDIDDKNDHATLLKHYVSVYADAQVFLKKLVLHGRLLFLMRETQSRDMIEYKTSLVNLQRMV